MANQNPSPKTRFEAHPDKLAAKPLSVRLPVDIDEAVRLLGHDWIRGVLRDAVSQLQKDTRHE